MAGAPPYDPDHPNRCFQAQPREPVPSGTTLLRREVYTAARPGTLQPLSTLLLHLTLPCISSCERLCVAIGFALAVRPRYEAARSLLAVRGLVSQSVQQLCCIDTSPPVDIKTFYSIL